MISKKEKETLKYYDVKKLKIQYKTGIKQLCLNCNKQNSIRFLFHSNKSKAINNVEKQTNKIKFVNLPVKNKQYVCLNCKNFY